MESAHIEHDLFLLMIQLSQIQDQNLVKWVFLESVNAIHPDLTIAFSDPNSAGQTVVMVIAHQGVLDEGVQFIQKPFSMKDIAVKVQNVLESVDDDDFNNHTELIKEK
ncbi:MAG TPA: hypothetical protein VJ959_00485 [Desulfotignum sp.]|nr:hypothetical protein [Desulfotignum sp.]